MHFEEARNQRPAAAIDGGFARGCGRIGGSDRRDASAVEDDGHRTRHDLCAGIEHPDVPDPHGPVVAVRRRLLEPYQPIGVPVRGQVPQAPLFTLQPFADQGGATDPARQEIPVGVEDHRHRRELQARQPPGRGPHGAGGALQVQVLDLLEPHPAAGKGGHLPVGVLQQGARVHARCPQAGVLGNVEAGIGDGGRPRPGGVAPGRASAAEAKTLLGLAAEGRRSVDRPGDGQSGGVEFKGLAA